jgi:hypothetical protein
MNKLGGVAHMHLNGCATAFEPERGANLRGFNFEPIREKFIYSAKSAPNAY